MGLHYPPKVKKLNIGLANRRLQAKHGKISKRSEAKSELNSVSQDEEDQDDGENY